MMNSMVLNDQLIANFVVNLVVEKELVYFEVVAHLFEDFYYSSLGKDVLLAFWWTCLLLLPWILLYGLDLDRNQL